MDNRNFNKLHQNSFHNDPIWDLAVAFWCEYYVSCERFDRTRCSLRTPDGTAIPETKYQSQTINTNAYRERKELNRRLQDWNIDRDMVQKAKTVASRMAYNVQEVEVKRITSYMLALKT